MNKIILDYDNKIITICEKIKVKDFDDKVCVLKRAINDIFEWEINIEIK